MKKNFLGIIGIILINVFSFSIVSAAFPATFTNWTAGTRITSDWLNAIEQWVVSSTNPLGSLANQATTTGNLLVGSSSVGWSALTVGANGKVLMASSTASRGVSWESISSGGSGVASSSPIFLGGLGFFTDSSTISTALPMLYNATSGRLTLGTSTITELAFTNASGTNLTLSGSLQTQSINVTSLAISPLVVGGTNSSTIVGDGTLSTIGGALTMANGSSTGAFDVTNRLTAGNVSSTGNLSVSGQGIIPNVSSTRIDATTGGTIANVSSTNITASTYLQSQNIFDKNGNRYSTSTGANPTASIGTSAVNGTATTFLRSDGAPALGSQFASSSISFNIGNPTSTNPDSFYMHRVNKAMTLQQVSCDEYTTATTSTIEVYKVTGGLGSTANGGMFIASMACGNLGNTQNTSGTNSLAYGDILVVNVTSTNAGVPTFTKVYVYVTTN